MPLKIIEGHASAVADIFSVLVDEHFIGREGGQTVSAVVRIGTAVGPVHVHVQPFEQVRLVPEADHELFGFIAFIDLVAVFIYKGQGGLGTFGADVHAEVLLENRSILKKILPDLVVIVLPAKGIDLGVGLRLGKVSQTNLVQQIVDCTVSSAVVGFVRIEERSVPLKEVRFLIVNHIVRGGIRQGVIQVEFRGNLVESGVFHRHHGLAGGCRLRILRRDDDDAVRRLGTPDGRCRGVFQDRDALDIVGIDPGETALDRESVDHDEGSAVV